MLRDSTKIPVIDLFAGPGGLGEGFSSFCRPDGTHPFQIALSIEKDPWAHATLLLRAWRRRWNNKLSLQYEAALEDATPLNRLRSLFPAESELANDEAVLLELGETTSAQVQELVASRVDYESPWVLVGGPPCQAYSLIGRARNKGNQSYRPEADHRQKLYIEYLQVLADHAPPVFIMENVKGLLSAQLAGEYLFQRIREDLEDPGVALDREGRKSRRNPRYQIRSLVDPQSLFAESQPQDFVVRSEDYGIPQARHRLILLGVREDLCAKRIQRLSVQSGRKTVGPTLTDLPRLRSGVNDGQVDSDKAWETSLRCATARGWYRQVPDEIQAVIRRKLDGLSIPRLSRGSDRVLRRTSGQALIYNHRTRSHMREDLDRYLFASCFALLHERSPVLGEFPKLLLPQHASAHAKETHFADRFRVQVKNRPSSTITSHISKDGHYYIHHDPTQCRSLTVREAARLQSFPDDYYFCGPRTAQYQQVGNAVPPELARQIARVVAAMLG